MKINYKKISALATSALMIGMTAGLAAAANYPAPFVTSGVGDVAVVYGTGTGVASTDQLQATNILEDLQGSMTSSTSTTVDTTGDVISLDTSSTRIWLNTSLNTAKSVFTKTDLPVVLADSTFSGNVDSKMTSTLKFIAGNTAGSDNSGKVIFAKQPTSSNDPQFGISMGTSQTSYPLYNATINFGTAVAFNHTDSEGETITLFGREFVVSTATDATNLILFSSAESQTLTLGGSNPNPSSTVTIAGVDYLVELVTGTSSTATVAVNGESKEINEGSSKKIGGIDIAIKSVTESTAIDTIVADVLIGSEKLTFTSASQVLSGSDDDPIDGTYVYLPGGPSALTELTITVFRPDSSEDAILPGATFEDPAFGGFKTYFEGMNIPTSNTDDRELITVQNSGDDQMSLTMTDDTGITKTFEFSHNQSGQQHLADDSNYTIAVLEEQNVSENRYVMLGNEDYGHLLEVTDIYNQTTGSSAITNDRVKLQDVITGDTYSATFTSTEGSGTITIDGKQYTVTFTGSDDTGTVRFKYPTSDSGATENVLYPTMKTSKGALVALYEPVFLNLSRLASDGSWGDAARATAVVQIPDGDGYSSITFTYYDGTANNIMWNVTGQSTGLNVSSSTAYHTATAIGKLTYNITATGTANMTKIYVTSPEDSTTNIDQPGLIIFEGKDDKNAYEVMVVDLESPAGTSTDGMGVSDIFFSSQVGYGHYSATMASDTDKTQDADWWGTVTTLDAGDSDQKTLTISYPESQIYAKVYIGESSALVSTGTAGGVVVKDTEVSSVSTSNLVIVGGSCINSAAASLLGGALCGESFTTASGVGSGQFLIKGYASSSITSKQALLVAGYDAADTVNAATYLLNNAVDTAKEYKGTTATSADLVVA